MQVGVVRRAREHLGLRRGAGHAPASPANPRPSGNRPTRAGRRCRACRAPASLDGCTSSPSRSRVVLSYSARVSRGSCDVVGTPGVHTVGSTGGGTMLVPRRCRWCAAGVPVPTVLPVPAAAGGARCRSWRRIRSSASRPPIEPSQPARSATPTMIVLVQVFMTLTSSLGGENDAAAKQPAHAESADVGTVATGDRSAHR